MAKQESSSFGTILTLGVIGIGAYFIYEWFFSTPAVTATPAPAQTPTLPAALPSPSSQPVGGPSAPAVSVPAPPTGSGSLDVLYSQLTSAATSAAPASGVGANDLQLVNGQPQTTFSGWNYFLLQADPSVGSLPTYQQVTGQTDPNSAMPGAQYWGIISPWLSKNVPGLAGLGFFGGLGFVARIARG